MRSVLWCKALVEHQARSTRDCPLMISADTRGPVSIVHRPGVDTGTSKTTHARARACTRSRRLTRTYMRRAAASQMRCFCCVLSRPHGPYLQRTSLSLISGHTCQEIYALRYGTVGRIPDAVVWPESSSQCEQIVKAADANNVVIIPFGGASCSCCSKQPPYAGVGIVPVGCI